MHPQADIDAHGLEGLHARGAVNDVIAHVVFYLEACNGGFREELGEPSVGVLMRGWAVYMGDGRLVLVLSVGREVLESCSTGVKARVAEVFG